MNPGEFWFDSADGLRLYSRVYATVRAQHTVLCLHGLTRNSRDFEDLAPHLAQRYRVIAPDLRGRGRSARDPNPKNYQLTVYGQDVFTLLNALGASRVAVLGTSLGGMMAMGLAATQPGLVSGIILNDVGPEFDPAGVERIKGYAGRLSPVRSWPEAVAQAQLVYGAAWPGLDAARWEVITRRGYRADANGVPQAEADPMIGEALRAAPTAAPNLWPLWAALKSTPALAIRGALSDLLSAATLERMQREKPDLRTLTVVNRGHVPLLDEPECLAAIDEFLASLT